MVMSLAIKYRPKSWDTVVGQNNTVYILHKQIETGNVKHAYLFCGPAGCGKTTCARIFANQINNGVGAPLELDAASHNGVDDVREIIQQARTQSIDSYYKVFIIDECHALSGSAWQAMLKVLEEPPAKSIFIFCTTDPQKIPATIISRVQRYDFKRISQKDIVCRLAVILDAEGYNDMDKSVNREPLEYIAKLADGGMRDALTLLDKCIAYSSEITLENAVKALGTVDYDTMFKLTDCVLNDDTMGYIKVIEDLYADGRDLKQFIKLYGQFIMDVIKYSISNSWEYISIPRLRVYGEQLISAQSAGLEKYKLLLNAVLTVNADIRYSSMPKYDIEAALMKFCTEVNDERR